MEIQVVHTAIVVTSWDYKAMHQLRQKSIELFGKKLVSESIETYCNGYLNFLIATCRSNVGASLEKEQEEKIKLFEEMVKEFDYGHGINPINYVVLEYGKDLSEIKNDKG